MQKNGVGPEGEEGDDAGGSSVKVDSGDHTTLTAILVSNGDSCLQTVVSDGDQLSPKKTHHSRTPSSLDQCRFFILFLCIYTYISLLFCLISFSLVPFFWGPEIYNSLHYCFCSSLITTCPIPPFSLDGQTVTEKPNILSSIGIWQLRPGNWNSHEPIDALWNLHFREWATGIGS